eukprot:m.247254 g.247254  ORF g.247254 m.247254 type:complete len:89 (+) comp40265_c0_seq24:767-1033(+)
MFDQMPSARTYHTLTRLEWKQLKDKAVYLLAGEAMDRNSDHGYILDLTERRSYELENAKKLLATLLIAQSNQMEQRGLSSLEEKMPIR